MKLHNLLVEERVIDAHNQKSLAEGHHWISENASDVEDADELEQTIRSDFLTEEEEIFIWLAFGDAQTAKEIAEASGLILKNY